MKSIYKYLPLLGILLGMAGFTACQDNFDNKQPAFEAPVAEHEANMTILDLKKMYWHEGDESDANYLNYCDTVGYVYNDIDDITGVKTLYPRNSDGTRKKLAEHIYIAGRVISNDMDGNVFKSLVIQDKTAALAISINQYDLYLQYRVGQEIVLDVTGMYIGKYRGLLQLGLPKYNEQYGYYETSFMPIEFFRMHAECNGFPQPSLVDTLTFNNFNDFSSTGNPEILMKYQSQLVRFNNVYFEDANGKTVFSEYKSSGVNRNIVDVNQALMPVRTSGYSTFWNNPLPQGNGDVVAILSYYASSASNAGYQLLLNSLAGCMNFGNPTVPEGESASNPYSIDRVIEIENAGATGSGWVTGYIVGAVKPEVENAITGNDDIEWGADVTLANTLVIAPAAAIKDVASCLIVPLPQGTPLRQYGNLVDNPSNYGKQIWLKGSFEKYMGAFGLSCSGAAADVIIDGVEIPGGDTPTADGDGSEANPYNLNQAMQVYNADGTTTPVWIECYIVGSVTDKSWNDAVFGTDKASTTNIVVASSAHETNKDRCMPVQLPAGDVRTALNLSANPGNLGKKVILYGTIEKYFGVAGIKNVTAYKLDGSSTPDTPDTPDTPGVGSGTGTETDPWNVDKVKELYNGATGDTGWLTCYIVGTCPSQYWSDAVVGLDNASNTNIIVASSPSVTSADACIPVQLPAGDVRNALSLQLNPGNLGKQVMLYGTIDKYFGVAGFKTVTAYKLDGSVTPDPNPNPNPDTPTGLGTEDAPISVASVIANYNAGTMGESWVEGYIIGTCPTQYWSDAVVGLDNASNTNVVLAPSASETDMSKCIPVQLPAGDVRNALSLQANPGNLGKRVKLHGEIAKYFGVAGFKSVTQYSFY